MKTRWFLRGLGIGIIISALFLCIGYREQSDHNELIKEAKKIGMVFQQPNPFPKSIYDNVAYSKTRSGFRSGSYHNG